MYDSINGGKKPIRNKMKGQTCQCASKKRWRTGVVNTKSIII